MFEPTDYLPLPISRFLEDCNARRSVPGGGCVSACAGALAASMSLMAANYSTGKKYEAVAGQMGEIIARLTGIQQELTSLMLADQQAFLALQAALKEKSSTVSAATEQAARIPLRMVELCAAGLADGVVLAEIGNRNLLSDVGVSAILFEAAARAAALNVRVNLPALPSAIAEDLRLRLQSGLGSAEARLRIIQTTLAHHGL